jgi:hypothetical protein
MATSMGRNQFCLQPNVSSCRAIDCQRGWRAGFIDATLGFMSRFVEDVHRAVTRGDLPQCFWPNDVRRACPGWLITRTACSFQSIDAGILAGTPSISCRIVTPSTASSAELYGRALMPRTGMLIGAPSGRVLTHLTKPAVTNVPAAAWVA